MIYDKTSKISFTAYGNDFLEYFGEYKKIIRELGAEFETLYGAHRRLDKLILVDDDTLQNWEFHVKAIDGDDLRKFYGYVNVKSAQTGKDMDCFIVSFADPENCEEVIKIGRTIYFAPIIKYLKKMEIHKKLSIIEGKVKDNIKISTRDELTLIFVTLATLNEDKEKIVKRVCGVLEKIDYIGDYRRTVIDSLMAFQIENFVKSKKDQDELNKVVDMQVSVEELFLQVEREAQYDNGYEHGYAEGKDEGRDEGKDEVIINMLEKSVSEDVIQKYVGCSLEHIRKVKNTYLAANNGLIF